jgi:hypothetical protein
MRMMVGQEVSWQFSVRIVVSLYSAAAIMASLMSKLSFIYCIEPSLLSGVHDAKQSASEHIHTVGRFKDARFGNMCLPSYRTKTAGLGMASSENRGFFVIRTQMA